MSFIYILEILIQICFLIKRVFNFYAINALFNYLFLLKYFLKKFQLLKIINTINKF